MYVKMNLFKDSDVTLGRAVIALGCGTIPRAGQILTFTRRILQTATTSFRHFFTQQLGFPHAFTQKLVCLKENHHLQSHAQRLKFRRYKVV